MGPVGDADINWQRGKRIFWPFFFPLIFLFILGLVGSLIIMMPGAWWWWRRRWRWRWWRLQGHWVWRKERNQIMHRMSHNHIALPCFLGITGNPTLCSKHNSCLGMQKLFWQVKNRHVSFLLLPFFFWPFSFLYYNRFIFTIKIYSSNRYWKFYSIHPY